MSGRALLSWDAYVSEREIRGEGNALGDTYRDVYGLALAFVGDMYMHRRTRRERRMRIYAHSQREPRDHEAGRRGWA